MNLPLTDAYLATMQSRVRQRAQEIVKAVEINSTRIRSLCQLAKMDARLGEVEQAKAYFARAAAIAAAMPDDRVAAQFSIIATAQANMGLIQDAIASAAQIEDIGFKSLALRNIALAQVNGGSIEAADVNARQIQDIDSRAMILAQVSHAEARQNPLAASSINHRNQSVLALLDQIEWVNGKVDILREVAMGFAAIGNTLFALLHLYDAIDLIEDVDDDGMKVRQLCRFSRLRGSLLDHRTCDDILSRAMQIADAMIIEDDIDTICRDSAYARSLQSWLAVQPDKCGPILEKIQTDEERASVLIKLAKHNARNGNPREAHDLLLQAQWLSLQSKPKQWYVEALTGIASAYHLQGNPGETAINLQIAERAALNLQHGYPAIRGLCILCQAITTNPKTTAALTAVLINNIFTSTSPK